jgi:hypothetical protein
MMPRGISTRMRRRQRRVREVAASAAILAMLAGMTAAIFAGAWLR